MEEGYLMLDRRSGEKVIIAQGTEHEVIIDVVFIRRSKVRLGFTANRGIPIHRGEVQAIIRREGRREKPDASL